MTEPIAPTPLPDRSEGESAAAYLQRLPDLAQSDLASLSSGQWIEYEALRRELPPERAYRAAQLDPRLIAKRRIAGVPLVQDGDL